ncbi:hypothetical protein GF312_21180 [Candidatus Poribacteria bacterium]|nr:hypothetical protein [Candidatus Poribacteria bacterium]
MKSLIVSLSAFILVLALSLAVVPQYVVGEEKMTMPFGTEDDVEFAKKLWKAMKGYTDWPFKTDVYLGQSPHGAYLKMFYGVVTVNETPYHIIIKDNYMGKDKSGNKLSMEDVAKDPQKYLAAVTIMLQQKKGYDPDNNDWFWAKYLADGSLDKNPKGMAMAGRVAKGMDAGCIACHKGAKDSDYLFFNDKM